MTQSLNILLVEDHHDSAMALAGLLRVNGYKVTVAESVESAKRAFACQCFDVLLCDIGLPDGDGCELLRDLQAIRPVCAIAITGYGMEEDVARCKEAGFVAFLCKPVDLAVVKRTLEDVMALDLCSPKVA